LKWKQTEDGLVIASLPEQKPCEYAFGLKVEGKDLAPVPMVVRPWTDGSVRLLPGESVLHGNHEMGEKDGMAHVGYWLNNDDYLTWRMEVPAPGTYKMMLCAANQGSGGEFVFEAAGEAPVINVQTHQDFAEYDVGKVEFKKAGIIDVKLGPGKSWDRNITFRSLTLRKM
jgi:alpha-L-fucosidase